MIFLKSWFNPEVSTVMEGLLSVRELMLESEGVTFFLVDDSGKSIIFHEAYNSPEPDARLK
jgi:C4-type Zn-finger protein